MQNWDMDFFELVHVYLHIFFRSIYSVYLHFSIYGFGTEMGYLHHQKKP